MTSLAVGSHHIVAIYQGDSSFLQSQSPVFNQIVHPAFTTTTSAGRPVLESSRSDSGSIRQPELSRAAGCQPGGGLRL